MQKSCKGEHRMIDKRNNEVVAFGPVSVANVGPCYDVLGYCLDHLGDFVKATKTDKHQEARLVHVYDLLNTGIDRIPYEDNCVQIVASKIWSDHYENIPEPKYGIDLTLYKAIPIISGFGSSAASSVATAKAMFTLMKINDDKGNFPQVANPLIYTENKVTNGHYYPDNIVPSYFGGFNVISPGICDELEVIDFLTVILWQDIKLDTGTQRNAINQFLAAEVLVPELALEYQLEKILGYIRYHTHCAARIVYGLSNGDLNMAGQAISGLRSTYFALPGKLKNEVSEYNLLEFVRSPRIDSYNNIKTAAIEAGAYGCAICGSGPSIFAITDDEKKASDIKSAMLVACGKRDAKWLISRVNLKGAQIIENLKQWILEQKVNHNFWDNVDTEALEH